MNEWKIYAEKYTERKKIKLFKNHKADTYSKKEKSNENKKERKKERQTNLYFWGKKKEDRRK